jgi:hypothetical protein
MRWAKQKVLFMQSLQAALFSRIGALRRIGAIMPWICGISLECEPN